MRTQLTDLLKIQYPIIQAPMGYIAVAELVAAVSEAGGLGCFCANAGSDERPGAGGDPNVIAENLRKQVRKAKKLTSKPISFSVVTFRRSPEGAEIEKRHIQIAIEESLPVCIMSGGFREEYIQWVKREGMKVLLCVSNARQAQKAASAGVDGVVVQVNEAGGHIGYPLPLTISIPLVRDAVKIPVVAAGGIVDGRGIAAAMALGADGVYIGTRFIATKECQVHQNFKQAIVEAQGDCTTAIDEGPGLGITRVLKNKYSEEIHEAQTKGASQEEIVKLMWPSLSGGRSRHVRAMIDGNMEEGSVPCGMGAALISDIPDTASLVKRLVAEYEQVVQGLPK